MAVTPHHEALKTLASLSVDEEFCQKVGGKVFRYTGEATPIYRDVCHQFSLLIDQMVEDLRVLKTHIPAYNVPPKNQQQPCLRKTCPPYRQEKDKARNINFPSFRKAFP